MPRAGDVVSGKYRLIHPLGMGGMGTVWRAEHIALRQQVALKLLHVRSDAAGETVKRFQREAQIAASIRHRNIVYISDFGTDGGEPYIVMELLSGVPLADRMVVGEPLSVGTFLHLIDESLQGLAAVHAAGVVHRDMKPENIFLVRESDGSTFPKLLDFGVSRSTDRGQGHTITREGFVMGTPEYVSPEQARGRMADVRSDIYSLGVMVYEALAGRLPFQADNPADLLVAVLKATPLPLSTLRPDLGSELSDLLKRAIDRDPDRRFQTCEEMRQALQSVIAQEPEVVTHFLPKRFLAPSSESPVQDSRLLPSSSTPSTRAAAREAETQVMARPKRPTARWLVAGAGLVAVATFGFAFGGGPSNARSQAQPSLRQEPTTHPTTARISPLEVSPQVTVELYNLPNAAKVSADGAPVEGSSLHFARDSGSHAIVVEAKGSQPWTVSHDAKSDGRYAVSLLPEGRVGKSNHVRSVKGGKKGLLRRPDF